MEKNYLLYVYVLARFMKLIAILITMGVLLFIIIMLLPFCVPYVLGCRGS